MNPFNENLAVGQLSELLALERGYNPEKARQIRNAAVLHDIGKQKLPQSILNKPGKLNAQEFEIIKTHTKLGVAMLSSIQGNLGELARNICLMHHEYINGKGYWGINAVNLVNQRAFLVLQQALLCDVRGRKKCLSGTIAVR